MVRTAHARDELKGIQRDYHDWEAATYDGKFSISYDQRCIDYATGRLHRVLPHPARFHRVLEVGSGTGFFLLNLALGGHLNGAELHASDLSPGMLEVCRRNAANHGVTITTTTADAENLPFDDGSFDLVVGHAFLHHLPVPALAMREIARVLEPGGTVVIAGEPTEIGSRITGAFKRAAGFSVSALDACRLRVGRPSIRVSSQPESHGEVSKRAGSDDPDGAHFAGLEQIVDLHTFRPRDVAHMVALAGLTDVRVVTEELVASWFGWSVRTIESLVTPEARGDGWPWWALRNYLRLQALDERLAGLVPPGWCYNLVMIARKPAGPLPVGA